MSAEDRWKNYNASLEAPATHATAVTPDDDNDLTDTSRALYIGGAGDVKLTTRGGETVTFAGLVAGTILPVMTNRVHATDTTATGIVSLW